MSANTIASWWVPFKIGVATESEGRKTTYCQDRVPLPDFLNIWPVLDHERELVSFAKRYFQDSAHGERSSRFPESFNKSIGTSAQFHAAPKRDLSQQ